MTTQLKQLTHSLLLCWNHQWNDNY